MPACWMSTSMMSIFFFHDTATTEIYTLSLHDALPISPCTTRHVADGQPLGVDAEGSERDRKSTRLNSSHVSSSYAGFCLKKKMYSRSASSTRDDKAEKHNSMTLAQRQ